MLLLALFTLAGTTVADPAAVRSVADSGAASSVVPLAFDLGVATPGAAGRRHLPRLAPAPVEPRPRLDPLGVRALDTDRERLRLGVHRLKRRPTIGIDYRLKLGR